MPRTKPARHDKVETVGDLEQVLQRSSAAIMTEYRGMTVAQISDLRRRLRPGGGEYHVVKNTLFRRALADKLTPELDSLLSGPTAVAFASDAVVTAKTLLDFLRDLRKPEVVVKGGYVDGRVYSPEQITALSKIPPREVVLSQSLGTLQAPLGEFVGLLN